MINLIKEGTSNTFAINPATSSIYRDTSNGSYRLSIVQDYDQSSASLDITELPPLTGSYYNNYILFSVNTSDIPSASGNYTYTLIEGLTGTGVWSTTAETWALADFAWSSTGSFTNDRNIDTGRLRVVGSDIPSYITYTGADQNGQYTTYHK